MTVSVIIPFYDLERYVRPCLDSVVAAARRVQGVLELEVICVDDGSTDGTAALLDRCASAQSQVTFRVLHKENGGEGSARNAGLAAATGDWITFLDGDDVWLGNHLEVAARLLASDADAEIVALKYAPFDDGTEAPPPTEAEPKTFETREELPSEVLLEVGVFPTFFRHRFLADERFSALPLGADRLFVAQCLSRVRRVVKCDAVVHGYRLRAGSMARAVWNARKVASQCDYAFGSLRALTATGKALGREGHAYLASLWLSDVPNRALRLDCAQRAAVAAHWAETLSDGAVVAALPAMDAARSVLRALARRAPVAAMRAAWLLRKVGIV